MAEKRIIRFEKWILKVIISYAVFIGIGWLLGRIPAEKIGLSEDMFFDLRMFFMLFGPIYLTLIVKIVLTILAVIKHKEKDTAEQNRGVLLAFTAILMLANLSNAQTAADLSSGLIESKGLKSLNRSKRYNLFTDCAGSTSATFLLRGGAEQFLEEAERSIHGAFLIGRS